MEATREGDVVTLKMTIKEFMLINVSFMATNAGIQTDRDTTLEFKVESKKLANDFKTVTSQIL